MDLFRVNAYSVSPSRREDPPLEPEGGAIAITPNLRQVIDDNLKSASLNKRTSVNFQVDTKTRTNETRDLIMSVRVRHAAAAQRLQDTCASTQRRDGPSLRPMSARDCRTASG